jgi:hypothetical protein
MPNTPENEKGMEERHMKKTVGPSNSATLRNHVKKSGEKLAQRGQLFTIFTVHIALWLVGEAGEKEPPERGRNTAFATISWGVRELTT